MSPMSVRNDELREQNLVAQREKERKNEREEVSLTNKGMSEKEPSFFRGFRWPGSYPLRRLGSTVRLPGVQK